MSTEKPKCARCGEQAETYNFEAETTFWGYFATEVETSIQHRLRLLASYWRRNPPPGGHAMLEVDERKPLCADCWGDLIGKFMQGRAVPAIEKKQGGPRPPEDLIIYGVRDRHTGEVTVFGGQPSDRSDALSRAAGSNMRQEAVQRSGRWNRIVEESSDG